MKSWPFRKPRNFSYRLFENTFSVFIEHLNFFLTRITNLDLFLFYSQTRQAVRIY
jgi:hypothetical protein